MWRVIGLMSGTSLDGVDVCVSRFWERDGRWRFAIEAFATEPLDPELRAAILAQMDPATSRVDALCALDARLGAAFADAALAVLARAGIDPAAVDLVGSHGQTLYHLPTGAWPSTMQLGDGSVIAVRTGLTTVSDFRPADMAAGGQGAPLVPHADRALFARPDRALALLNLGGIANLTLLPSGGEGQLLAFDVGPANMVIDRFVERATEGRDHYDRDGALASRGRLLPEWLDAWLMHPFFSELPPKSTGREAFGHAWADAQWDAARAEGASAEDLVATATALTAHGIAQALRAFAPPGLRPAELVVSGGGARNPALMAMLRDAVAPLAVSPLDAHGVPGDAKEALAFALFALEAALGRPNHAPEATGASRSLVLGKIAPGRNFGGLRQAPWPREAATEAVLPASRDLDGMDTEDIVALMNREDEHVVAAVERATGAIAKVADAAASALEAGGRLLYVGAGTSGRLGVLDAAECPPTFSTPGEWVQGVMAGGEGALLHAVEGAEDDRAAGAAAMGERSVGPRDCVVGIAASGRTPFVHGALEAAKQRGAWTALITCNPLDAPPHYLSCLVELVTGPEVLSGSTRLKAGTATKMALNMISTAAMVRLGKVYGNRMVDVKVSNLKLADRARRMVELLGDVDATTAQRLLDEAGGSAKVAIAAARLGCTTTEAECRLVEVGGRLRSVIGAPS